MGKLPKIGFSFNTKSIFSVMRGKFAHRIASAVTPISEKVINFIEIDDGKAGVKFRDKYSPFVLRVTMIITIAVVGVAAFMFFNSSGAYLSAWFISLALSVAALFIMSIPRYVKVSQNYVEIHCLLEMTRIPLRDIRRIHRIERYRVRRLFPILGSYGFGGYFGYYFDAIHMRLVRIYAKKLSGVVVIQDIYNTRYYVSCQDPALFVNTVRFQITKLREEDIVLDKASGDDDDSDEDES